MRLPNWLGDLVMSSAFLLELRRQHPEAAIYLIIKDILTGLVPLLPGGPWAGVHSFSKLTWPGMLGPWRFGRDLRQTYGPFDSYFSLPNSASAALVGLGCGAPARIGYRGEAGWLFTDSRSNQLPGTHRAEAYAALASSLEKPGRWNVALLPPPTASHAEGQAALLVNVNSEAQSRRLPVSVALRVLAAVRATNPSQPLTLIGAPKERAYVQAVIDAAPGAWRSELINAAGSTNLPILASRLAGARLLVSSDSGPAHLASALGTPVVVLFGQGFEAQTGPLGPGPVRVVRAPGERPCGRCPSNRCRFGDEPPCLTNITSEQLAAAIREVAPKPTA